MQSGEQPVAQISKAEPVGKSDGIWESKTFGWRDFIDMINPLQHLPVISVIYRKLTGDEMGDAPRIVGGAIFGGVLGNWISGLASAVANVFVERSTGKDIADHVFAAVQPEPEPVRNTENRAANPPASPPVALNLNRMVAAEQEVVLEKRDAVVTQSLIRSSDRGVNQRLADQGVNRSSVVQSADIAPAINAYRQQLLLDEIRHDTSYWV